VFVFLTKELSVDRRFVLVTFVNGALSLDAKTNRSLNVVPLTTPSAVTIFMGKAKFDE